MKIIISNSSADPIYEQIGKQIKAQILSGDLEEGSPLPSIRRLAQDLQISVITTKRAYDELEAEGFLNTVGGKGTFVAVQNKELLREKRMKSRRGGPGPSGRRSPVDGNRRRADGRNASIVIQGEFLMSAALEIIGLRKGYKGFALKDVTFAVSPGTIMGLVGPNGAGKTTVIKLILNLVRREGGTVKVFGLDSLAEEKAVKARIGFVHETPALVEDVRLKDLAAATALFYPTWDERRFQSTMKEFELNPVQKFKTLSHGMKMKFSLALALSHEADLLVLDEPTSGLDPVFRRELLERLSGVIQDGRKSVLFSTHITSDLERTADYITLLLDGAVVFSSTRDEVRDGWAVVKGGPELLETARKPLFRGFRESPYGVEALTADIPAARAAFPKAVFDRASIEDIMIFLNPGASHD